MAFSSNTGHAAAGIAVFKEGSVNGGDEGYLYTGKKTQEDGRFKSTLTIKRWNSSAQSVFGSIDQFALELEGGSSDGVTFVATGMRLGNRRRTSLSATGIWVQRPSARLKRWIPQLGCQPFRGSAVSALMGV